MRRTLREGLDRRLVLLEGLREHGREESGRTPDTYGEAFLSLADEGIIGDDLAGRLRRTAGLRNILAHGYLAVDPGSCGEQLPSRPAGQIRRAAGCRSVPPGSRPVLGRLPPSVRCRPASPAGPQRRDPYAPPRPTVTELEAVELEAAEQEFP